MLKFLLFIPAILLLSTRPQKPQEKKTESPQDTILNTLSAVVDKKRFVINYTNKYEVYILDSKKRIIFKEEDSAPAFDFVDFNQDGFKDILLHYSSNVPAIQNLLLYNKKIRSFQAVLNFPDFPDPKRIRNTRYYYSYHRSGCADLNWTSDLFYIENYKAIKIASINGYECEDSGIKDGIYISKASKKKTGKIITLPIQTIKAYKSYKWGFIADYWTKNYRRFIR